MVLLVQQQMVVMEIKVVIQFSQPLLQQVVVMVLVLLDKQVVTVVQVVVVLVTQDTHQVQVTLQVQLHHKDLMVVLV